MLFDESTIVEVRLNQQLSSSAAVSASAFGSTQSKKGNSAFRRVLKKLDMTVEARAQKDLTAYEDDEWLAEGGGVLDPEAVMAQIKESAS